MQKYSKRRFRTKRKFKSDLSLIDKGAKSMRKLKQVLRSPFSVLRSPFSVLRSPFSVSSPELRLLPALIILALALSACDNGSPAAGGAPRLAGNIVISNPTVSQTGAVTVTYTGTEQGVSIQWRLDGELFGEEENGATSMLPTSGRVQGIYTVTASAPALQALQAHWYLYWMIRLVEIMKQKAALTSAHLGM